MIGKNFNYDDVFLRSVTIAVLDTLEGEIKWDYNFSSGKREVSVPFYYSLTGDEKFVLDAFSDDVVSNNRLIALNADQTPRGVLTLTGFDMLTEQLGNPNVWIATNLERNDELLTTYNRIRPIPISIKYELVIALNSENDYFKCSEALMNTIGVYRYMEFQYNHFNINAVMQLPDGNQFEKERNQNFTTNNQVKLTSTFEVITYYPGYRRPGSDGIRANDGPCPDNGWSDAYTYDSFKNETENNIIIPKRTKWYSNIRKSSGNQPNNGNINNTNDDGV